MIHRESITLRQTSLMLLARISSTQFPTEPRQSTSFLLTFHCRSFFSRPKKLLYLL